ncbi:Hypothetical predicted protein [Paramuricea clavata]|uniref:Uncharacterized protein n=1 Tax=Paramuricea clavata TaxID=317549 RepID=A0A7D9JRH5_PARCT|nr:Hypothetical predicted protein [Paramuricea clavata]
MNRQRVTLLVLLDLSSAFDTIDHGILLERLRSKFGIRGKVLSWFSSYLSGRSQRVMLNVLQSAYRRYHSTETALLKVLNDILLSMNSQRVTLLVLLDLSSAFDTIDHGILLERLRSKFGIRGTVLSWFSSYLSG